MWTPHPTFGSDIVTDDTTLTPGGNEKADSHVTEGSAGSRTASLKPDWLECLESQKGDGLGFVVVRGWGRREGF